MTLTQTGRLPTAQLAWRFLTQRRRLAIGIAHLIAFVISGAVAFELRFEFSLDAAAWSALASTLPVWLAVKTLVFRRLNLDRGWWRFFSFYDFTHLTAGNVIASAASAAILIGMQSSHFSGSIILLDLLLSLQATASLRIGARFWRDHKNRRASGDFKRTLIYGAGCAGTMLLCEARANTRLKYYVCGFLDDNSDKEGLLIQGVRVLGGGNALKRLVQEQNIEQIIISIPSADSQQMSRITTLCQDAGVVFHTMPAISEILSDHALVKQVRDVAIEDVLGRSSVRLEDHRIFKKVENNIMLVTGAAGSIGSELCRQIARYRPAKLVAFELSETALFFLEREIKSSFPDLVFCPEIGNIQNLQRLREVFAQHHPALVLHAAAYKHVPLMEQHMFEAVENNVFGTYNLGIVASEYGAQDFVMISSDKAVNPTNVMGATKRVAELVIRSLQNSGSRFVSVRFGNVLGSNGSVVPIFKKQIAAGGPITITHPDMERYFMTIPEAAQLVLQASTMGHGGEIFVLDMGKPVKILDLARQLICLSGLKPDEDIRIEFTGMRPGEKLFEELNMADEEMLSTRHEKIKIFAGNSLPAERMSSHLHRLREACKKREIRSLIKELRILVPDYTVSKDVTERAFTESLVNLGGVLQINSGSPSKAVSLAG